MLTLGAEAPLKILSTWYGRYYGLAPVFSICSPVLLLALQLKFYYFTKTVSLLHKVRAELAQDKWPESLHTNKSTESGVSYRAATIPKQVNSFLHLCFSFEKKKLMQNRFLII